MLTDQEKVDKHIEELVKLGMPRDDATIAVDLSEKAAEAAFAAMAEVLKNAPNADIGIVARMNAVQLMQVNARAVGRALLVEAFLERILGLKR